jgi:hypothetical protein
MKKTSRKTRKTGTQKKNKFVDAAVAATVELGKAAESFQNSMEHVQAARRKGAPIAASAKRTVKAARKTIKAAGKSVAKVKRRVVG